MMSRVIQQKTRKNKRKSAAGSPRRRHSSMPKSHCTETPSTSANIFNSKSDTKRVPISIRLMLSRSKLVPFNCICPPSFPFPRRLAIRRNKLLDFRCRVRPVLRADAPKLRQNIRLQIQRKPHIVFPVIPLLCSIFTLSFHASSHHVYQETVQ